MAGDGQGLPLRTGRHTAIVTRRGVRTSTFRRHLHLVCGMEAIETQLAAVPATQIDHAAVVRASKLGHRVCRSYLGEGIASGLATEVDDGSSEFQQAVCQWHAVRMRAVRGGPEMSSASTACALAVVTAPVDDLIPDLVALRHDLHTHPELAFEELRMAGIVANALRLLGLEVHEGIGGTGVVGTLRCGAGAPAASACAPTWTHCRWWSWAGVPTQAVRPASTTAAATTATPACCSARLRELGGTYYTLLQPERAPHLPCRRCAGNGHRGHQRRRARG